MKSDVIEVIPDMKQCDVIKYLVIIKIDGDMKKNVQLILMIKIKMMKLLK